MSKFCQLVIGPAGCGKSTYCETIQTYAASLKRRCDIINLDPANDLLNYQPIADIKDLICLEDVMEDEDLNLGPNGGLVFCMEYLLDHMDWLKDIVEEGDDDYILFDCPGQIELYCHSEVMTRLVEHLTNMNFHVVVVFIIDSNFLTDAFKFTSGALCALASIVNLNAPSFCVMSKVDLLDPQTKENLDDLLDPTSFHTALDSYSSTNPVAVSLKKIMSSLATCLDEYGLVRMVPLDITDESSVEDLFSHTDQLLQYSDYADVKVSQLDEG